MKYKEFQAHKCRFIKAFRQVLCEQGTTEQLLEAAFCAYTDANPLIRLLFWRRVSLTIKYLESRGPYKSILDFGCGGGAVLPLLAPFSERVVGIDLDLEPYRALSRLISFPDNIEVHETRQEPMSKFADGSFDVVVSLDVLEHVEDLEEVFAELCRVIKADGMLVFSGPTENFFYQVGRWIAGEEYTGDYHVRNIFDVRRVADRFMEIKTLATMYYPFPLFKIYAGRVRQ